MGKVLCFMRCLSCPAGRFKVHCSVDVEILHSDFYHCNKSKNQCSVTFKGCSDKYSCFVLPELAGLLHSAWEKWHTSIHICKILFQ